MLHALLLSLSLFPSQELDRPALEALVEPYLASSGVPGCVVGQLVDGRPGRVEAFGLADLEEERPMTVDARFQVGSVTKSLTATLVALLAEDGTLAWDASLGELLSIEGALAPITLLQLATHTSGLPREPINRRDIPDSPSVMLPMSVEELLEGLRETSLERAPGESWSYSNLGYAVLGAVAGAQAGKAYPALLEERVLQPLGMTSSGVYVGAEEVPGLASCYWPEDETPVARAPWSFGSACAFSGLVSTAPDLLRFLTAQLEGAEPALLTPSMRAVLHRKAALVDPSSGRAMAAGWFLDRLPGDVELIGHGGELDGHSAIVVLTPRTRSGLVLLCNRGDDAARGLLSSLVGPWLAATGAVQAPAEAHGGDASSGRQE